MLGLIMLMCGVMLAIWVKEQMQVHEGGDKAVESAKGKAVGYIDRLFKG